MIVSVSTDNATRYVRVVGREPPVSFGAVVNLSFNHPGWEMTTRERASNLTDDEAAAMVLRLRATFDSLDWRGTRIKVEDR